MKRFCIILGVVMFFAALGRSEAAFAAKLYVTNNGIDSATCGAKDAPCRSISRAIQNASDGDKIIVGPGRYGDLNGDVAFDDPGDEAAEGGSGCSCMIKINKPVTIESRDGAAATVLDASGVAIDVVKILTSGVVFGKKKKGFTLRRGSIGLAIADGTNGIGVTGNLTTANSASGFSFAGSGHVFTGNIANANGFSATSSNGFVFSGSGHVLIGNVANDNTYHGFLFSGSGHVLTGNQAIANTYVGFFFSGSGHVLTGNIANTNGFEGYIFSGSSHVLTGNIANANVFAGFRFSGNGHVLTRNVATANSASGFTSQGSGHVLSGNAAIGNKLSGIVIGDSGGIDSATITKNNIFGNYSQTDFGFSNCGLFNSSGDSVTAPNNFWGAATGPGADPADNICHYGAGSSTTVPSFATKEFKVKVKVLDEMPTDVVPAPALKVADPSVTRLSVYSLRGQLVAFVSDSTRLAQASQSLPHGVYLAVRTYADGRREMVKVVVTK